MRKIAVHLRTLTTGQDEVSQQLACRRGQGLVVGSRQGLEKVIEIKLTAEEKSALDRSAASVRELVSSLQA